LSFLLQKLAVLDEDAYGELVKGYWQRKPEALRKKNLSLAAFSITTLTWNVLVSKTSACDDKQVTNSLRNGMNLWD
jgi:hypothetical protein